jgi:Mlc titration factor MtfA (ptsG expression regulator)
LGTREQQERWEVVSKAEYATFRARLDHNAPTFLDPYGGTNQAEFFAVASEAFFEDAHGLRFHHPRLFFCLTEVYQTDPTDW